MRTSLKVAILASCLAIGVSVPMACQRVLYSAIWLEADESEARLRRSLEDCRRQLESKERNKWSEADKELDGAIRKVLRDMER